MRTLRFLTAIVLILSLFVGASVVAPGVEGDLTSDLKAAQQKMNQLKAQLQEIQKLIKENKSAKYNLLSQLTSLNDQVDQLEGDIGDIDSRIAQLESLLSKTAAQIVIREKQYNKLSAGTGSSIDLLYHVSNLSLIHISEPTR